MRDFAFPAVAIVQKPRLVEVEFFTGFGGEFEIRPLDDSVDRAGFLAEATINALHHVDVITHRAAGTVVAARPGLDGDGLGRTDRLAELACDAALFAVRIAAQRMLATEARADRPLFERVIDRRLLLEARIDMIMPIPSASARMQR